MLLNSDDIIRIICHDSNIRIIIRVYLILLLLLNDLENCGEDAEGDADCDADDLYWGECDSEEFKVDKEIVEDPNVADQSDSSWVRKLI